jgi:uncharacterized repeat protein (TIGR01451 family)
VSAAALAATGDKPHDPAPPPPRGPLTQQQASVILEWNGPANARVGHATDYNLTVRNVSAIAVQEVMVRVRIPTGMTVVSAEPRGLSEGNVFAWELGSLLAKQEKTLQLRLQTETRGDFTPQAWVTFTGSSLAKIQVREPRLVIKAAATEHVMVGDTATITFTISNTGDGPAEQVRVHALLADALEHPRGKRVDFEVGNMAAGESRSVQVICTTRNGGDQKCDGYAEAEGGLKAQIQALVHVIMPRLDLQMVGPGLRYVDRKASYSLRLSNPGDAAATNVTVNDVLPAGFKFVSATDGGRLDPNTRTVSWFLGEVAPGQMREVKVEAVAAVLGEQRQQATAQAARGLRAETDLTTQVEGLSALVLEVTDTEDPIEVGSPMAYEVRIINNGSKTETDIHIACMIPEKMEFKGAQGPIRYRQEGNQIIFEPVSSLAPKADLQLRLNVKPMMPGDARFTLQVTSSTLQEPLLKMEATRIYSDMPNSK